MTDPHPPEDDEPDVDPDAADERARWEEVSQRWNEVGERFQALGSQVRHQWAETKSDEEMRESQRTIDAALQQIADAAGRVVHAISESVRDSEARQGATSAASSLAEAFADTVQAAVEEVRSRLRGRPEPDRDAEPPTLS